MRRFLTILLLLSTATLVTCGDTGGDGSDVTPAASTPATAVSTKADTGEPPLLSPGTYTSEVFSPEVSVTLADNHWRMVVDTDAAFVFEREETVDGGTGFVGFFRVGAIRSQANFGTSEPAPDDFVAWLMNHRDIEIGGGPSAVEIDGFTGRQVDIRTGASYDVPLFDDFELAYRDAVRFIQVDVDGQPTLIVAGPENWFRFEEFKAFAEPVIATVDFE